MNPQKEEGKVRVKFVTNDQSIRVTETPFAVPLRLGRLGLSEVVNHLRAEDDAAEHKPFDFLINGKFIRTSLEAHIKRAGLSEEPVITVEYLEAITEPKKEKENQHDDWIASVDGSATMGGLVVTGCYDFGVRIANLEAETLVTGIGHKAGVKCVAWANDRTPSALKFVSASLDKTLRLWEADVVGKTIRSIALFAEHTGTVESVQCSPDGAKMVSGSMDAKIKIWNLENITETTAQAPSKKRRGNKSAIPDEEITTFTECLSDLIGHSQGVRTVTWPTQFQILSGSMDHTIKLWDIESMSCSDTMSGLIASAHADRNVRLWDPRVKDGKFNVQSLQSHKSWVTSVRWKPNSANQLISASHDGTVKLWDTRSKIPLFTLNQTADNKVLSASWMGPSTSPQITTA
eukprot:gene16166-19240_t